MDVDWLPFDENRGTMSRKRKSKSKVQTSGAAKMKVKTPFSSRKPLGEVVGVNQSVAPQSEITVHTDPVKQSSPPTAADHIQSLENYCGYLRSIMECNLYSLVDKDVFSKLKPDATVEEVELLVTAYLQSDSTGVVPEEPPPPPTNKSKAKKARRRTADYMITQCGISMTFTPSPPANKSVVPRRRSRRLRDSLSVYREQGTLSTTHSEAAAADCLNEATELDDVKTPIEDPHREDSRREDPHREDPPFSNEENIEVSMTDNLTMNCSDESAFTTDATVTDDITDMMEDCSMNRTYILNDDLDSEINKSCDDISLTPELESYYKNEIFIMPQPTPFSTIYEVPRRFRGEQVFVSKGVFYRYYDFSDGCWYRVPIVKMSQRVRKAKANGRYRKPLTPTQDTQLTDILTEKLHQLDLSLQT